jgi:hypothetical protein
MNQCFFEDRTARQRLAAELIVAKIERNQRLRRLQEQAIQRANRRRFHRCHDPQRRHLRHCRRVFVRPDLVVRAMSTSPGELARLGF